jgi:hypothetical protein
MPGSPARLTSAAVQPEATRGVLFAVVGIVILALNVIDATDRGASAGNVVAIAAGAFFLFWGFAVVARSGRPPSS